MCDEDTFPVKMFCTRRKAQPFAYTSKAIYARMWIDIPIYTYDIRSGCPAKDLPVATYPEILKIFKLRFFYVGLTGIRTTTFLQLLH